MFVDGSFSSTRSPRADAAGLESLTADALCAGFQVTNANPLVGVEGRLMLMQSLGRALRSSPKYFAGERPGGLYDWAKERSKQQPIRATDLLSAVLEGLGSIWPGRTAVDGVPLGDGLASFGSRTKRLD